MICPAEKNCISMLNTNTFLAFSGFHTPFGLESMFFLLQNEKNNLKCQLDEHTGESYLCHFDISVCSVSSGRPKYNVAISISPFLSLQHVQDCLFLNTERVRKAVTVFDQRCYFIINLALSDLYSHGVELDSFVILLYLLLQQ